MYDVAQMLRCHNYSYIIKAIQRVAKLTISWSDHAQGGITHLVHRATWNQETGELWILFDRNFYEACISHYLKIDLDIYSQLSPVAKNLYDLLPQ